MQVKHIDHLNMSVTDLDASTDWYRRVFGFETVQNGVWEGHRWAIVRTGEALLCQYEYPERGPLREETLDAHRLHGLNHFGLRITDREAWEATVEREHVEILEEDRVRWPHSRAWYVRDPSGYRIEVALWDGDEIRFSG